MFKEKYKTWLAGPGQIRHRLLVCRSSHLRGYKRIRPRLLCLIPPKRNSDPLANIIPQPARFQEEERDLCDSLSL